MFNIHGSVLSIASSLYLYCLKHTHPLQSLLWRKISMLGICITLVFSTTGCVSQINQMEKYRQ